MCKYCPSLLATGQFWIRASWSSEEHSYTYRGSFLTFRDPDLLYQQFPSVSLLMWLAQPSFDALALLHFTTGCSESCVKLPDRATKGPCGSTALSSRTLLLKWRQFSLLSLVLCESATCPTGAQGLSKKVQPTGTQSILAGACFFLQSVSWFLSFTSRLDSKCLNWFLFGWC